MNLQVQLRQKGPPINQSTTTARYVLPAAIGFRGTIASWCARSAAITSVAPTTTDPGLPFAQLQTHLQAPMRLT